MRFAVAHKAATYLMIGFAYLAMIAGGAIQPLIAVAGLVGLVGSWWWEPPTVQLERWSWIWTVASVFALVYSVLTAAVTGDFLGVGAQFLIWLVLAKSYNRRAARDWQQLYLLSLLMLVAGSVLNADLTYGLCFLGFVIAATWAITLFHLRREMEDNLLVKHTVDRTSQRVEVRRILDSRRIVGARFFAGTGLLSLGVFVLASIVFLAIPRVGFGFFLKSRGGLTLTGFSDGVTLGGHGVIKNDSTVVMRVEIDPRFGGRDRPEIHWRGVAFDQYSRGQWRRSLGAPQTLEVLDVVPRSGLERHTISWYHAAPFAREDGVKQEIWLDPLDSDVLFGASNPRVFETATVARKRKPTLPRNDEFRLEHGSTIHYTVWSQVDPPRPETLRAARGNLPRGYGVYLQLPPEITPQTRELAARITAGLPTAYDKAVAIERWLESNLSYTLKLEDPGATEPVHFFLFDRKKGHCEYFASAFAVLARAAGLYTRQVNGFLGGEWNEYQRYVAVRAGDAHSWAEVFFPGAGWVTFDPTPSAPGGQLGRGGSGWSDRLGRFVDTLRFQWTRWVVDYDLAAQISLFKDIGTGIKSVAERARALAAAVLARWWIAALVAGAIGVVALLRRAPARALTGGAGRRRARSRIAASWDRVVRALAGAGARADAATTPRELAAQLTARRAPAAAEVSELVELYYAAEWGGRGGPDAEARAAELARSIERRLRDVAPPS